MLEQMQNYFLFVQDNAVSSGLAVLALSFVLFGLDDLFIDLVAWTKGLRPQALSADELKSMASLPEKNLAIMVAAWKEDGVLEKMVRGNRRRLDYKSYTFFLGVYPNDPKTRIEAERLSSKYPNVHVVVNPEPGPTSKGQMVNEIVRGVLAAEQKLGTRFDAFLIHDCEDVIHRQALKLINWKLETSDFVQVPVFSFSVPARSFVANTYVDEFSESHTKEILVRDHFGLPVPSAGVGTALSRKLVTTYQRHQEGDLLNGDSVTEDYELGVSTGQFGLKSTFACHYIQDSNGQKDFIATREYFPKKFTRSVRQRARWTLGIAYQGTEHLGWRGSLAQKYFLFRDRKGVLTNTLVAVSLTVFILGGILAETQPQLFAGFSLPEGMQALVVINLLFMMNRIVQRMICVSRIYGLKAAALVPLRIPVSNIINALAAFSATYQYAMSKLLNRRLTWAKTEHELPAGFGVETELPPVFLSFVVDADALEPVRADATQPAFALGLAQSGKSESAQAG